MARYDCSNESTNFIGQASVGDDLQQPLLQPDQTSPESTGDHENCGVKPPVDHQAAQPASQSHKEHLRWWLAYLLCTAQFQQLAAAVGEMKGSLLFLVR